VVDEGAEVYAEMLLIAVHCNADAEEEARRRTGRMRKIDGE
jgi:hypothetical protein